MTNLDMSDFVKSQRFQEKLKTVKTKLSEEISQAILRRPEKMRDWILQILYKYPDLLDDKSGPHCRIYTYSYRKYSGKSTLI